MSSIDKSRHCPEDSPEKNVFGPKSAWGRRQLKDHQRPLSAQDADKLNSEDGREKNVFGPKSAWGRRQLKDHQRSLSAQYADKLNTDDRYSHQLSEAQDSKQTPEYLDDKTTTCSSESRYISKLINGFIDTCKHNLTCGGSDSVKKEVDQQADQPTREEQSISGQQNENIGEKQKGDHSSNDNMNNLSESRAESFMLKREGEYPGNLSTLESFFIWHNKLDSRRKMLTEEDSEMIQVEVEDSNLATKKKENYKSMAKNIIGLAEYLKKERDADIETVLPYLKRSSESGSLSLESLEEDLDLETLKKATERIQKIMSYDGSEINEVRLGISSDQPLRDSFDQAINKIQTVQTDILNKFDLEKVKKLNIYREIKHFLDSYEHLDENSANYEKKLNIPEIYQSNYYVEYKSSTKKLRKAYGKAPSYQELDEWTPEELSKMSKELAPLFKDASEKLDKVQAYEALHLAIPKAQKLIDDFQKFKNCQKVDLVEIKDIGNYENVTKCSETLVSNFETIKSYYKDNEINVKRVNKVLKSIEDTSENFSNSLKKLAADTQKVRSEAKLPLDQLSKRYGFYIGPEQSFEEEFDKRFINHWTKMFYKYRDEIQADHPEIQTPEQYIDALHKKAGGFVKDKDVWTRRRFQTLDEILSQSVSVREAGTSVTSKERIDADKNFFDYTQDTTHPTLGITYAYLAEEPSDSCGETGHLSGYGSVAILWKDHIKDRTTTSLCDSLAQKDNVKPAPYHKPDARIFSLEDGNPLRYERIKPYREGQIHLGTHIEVDIKAFYFTNRDELPRKDQVEQLNNKLGIEVWIPSQSTEENSEPYKRIGMY